MNTQPVMNDSSPQTNASASNSMWLLGFARQATVLLTGSVISRLIGHTLGAALLALPAWFVGQLALGVELGVGWLLVGYVLIALGKALTRYTEQLFGHLAAFRLMGEMRVWMIDKLIPQAPAVTEGVGAARLNQTALKDVDRVEVFFAHTIAPTVSAAVIPLVAVVFTGFTAGWPTAGALAVVLVIGVVLPLLWHRQAAVNAVEQARIRGDITQHVADSMRMKTQLHHFQAVRYRLATLDALDDALTKNFTTSSKQAGRRKFVSDLRLYLGTALVLVVGLYTAELPWALAAATLVFGTNNSLEAVERLANSLPQGLTATGRIRQLAEQPPAVTEPETAASHPDADSVVRLQDVCFRYPGATEPALDGLSLDFDAPFIGVTGATGSGKSTLASLLHRHIDPDSGAYTIGGTSAAELGSDYVQTRIGLVEQNPFFINGTVAENLRLADEHASKDTLAWALETAGLEVALDREVGRRAGRLSGGQRQRLALARTLVRVAPQLDRAIIILDEATSHQDPITQQDMMNRVLGLGVQLVVIAHRLETLKPADNIVVLEQGQIVEQGTYQDLASRGGAFARLLES